MARDRRHLVPPNLRKNIFTYANNLNLLLKRFRLYSFATVLKVLKLDVFTDLQVDYIQLKYIFVFDRLRSLMIIFCLLNLGTKNDNKS